MKLNKETIKQLKEDGFEIREQQVMEINTPVDFNSFVDVDLEKMQYGDYKTEVENQSQIDIPDAEVTFTVYKNKNVYDPYKDGRFDHCDLDIIKEFISNYEKNEKPKKIYVDINEKLRLVAEFNQFPYNKEICVTIEKKGKNHYEFFQDIARISPDYFVNEEVKYSDRRMLLRLWNDENNEEFNYEKEVDIRDDK